MTLTDAEFNREYEAALERGEERLRTRPLATSVRYDRRSRRIVIELNNGCSMLLPPQVLQGLATASAAELSDAKILGPGTTLAWPRLDVHFSVEGLLAGRVGTARWMKQLAAGTVAATETRSHRRAKPVLATKRRLVKRARS